MISVQKQVLYESMIDILSKLYGSDYELSKVGSGYELVIKFPEITIQNSKGNSHKIFDLYFGFKFQIDEEKMRFQFRSQPYGWRGKYQLNEAGSWYHHSHLHSGNYSPGNNYFCLGTGPIAQLFMMYQESFKQFSTVNDFEDFFFSVCLLINGYVAWESIEGVPYYQISNLVKISDTESQQEFTNPVSKDEVKNYYISLRGFSGGQHRAFAEKVLERAQFSFDPNTLKFKIINEPTIDAKDVDGVYDNHYEYDCCFLKKVQGNQYQIKRIYRGQRSNYSYEELLQNAETFVSKIGTFRFKGKTIKPELILEKNQKSKEDNKENDETGVYHIHPQVITLLESHLTDNFIKNEFKKISKTSEIRSWAKQWEFSPKTTGNKEFYRHERTKENIQRVGS